MISCVRTSTNYKIDKSTDLATSYSRVALRVEKANGPAMREREKINKIKRRNQKKRPDRCAKIGRGGEGEEEKKRRRRSCLRQKVKRTTRTKKESRRTKRNERLCEVSSPLSNMPTSIVFDTDIKCQCMSNQRVSAGRKPTFFEYSCERKSDGVRRIENIFITTVILDDQVLICQQTLCNSHLVSLSLSPARSV